MFCPSANTGSDQRSPQAIYLKVPVRMDYPAAKPLRVGDWCVDPLRGEISREGQIVRLEGRTMQMLLYLAGRAGEVVSIDELLDQVWSGVVVTPDSVYQAVASLRRLLGDDARQPAYLVTVPRLGYRLIATISPGPEQPVPALWHSGADPACARAAPPTESATPASPAAAPTISAATMTASPRPMLGSRRVLAVAAVALCFVLALGFLLRDKVLGVPHPAATTASPVVSVAVLPFLDLTSQAMDEEYFADGMTEELIDRLSRIPGLRVPSPTSSFYFKGKRITVADAAQSLGVAYVLDGSIRKSDSTLRIAARLVRASDGYVVWSETYDRSVSDQLKVQDDIAGEVAKALQAAMH
jgi:transcriptional activator of cad operon